MHWFYKADGFDATRSAVNYSASQKVLALFSSNFCFFLRKSMSEKFEPADTQAHITYK